MRKLIVEEDEALSREVRDGLSSVIRQASESVHTNAWLRPMGLRRLIGRVGCDEPKVDFVAACYDIVINDDSIAEAIAQL